MAIVVQLRQASLKEEKLHVFTRNKTIVGEKSTVKMNYIYSATGSRLF